MFALNECAIGDQGINYPSHPSLSRAKEGKITSGNANHIPRIFKGISNNGNWKGDYLFSSEALFGELTKRKVVLERLVREGFKIVIILFIRDPVEHLISSHCQHVKRAGKVFGVDKLFESYNIPEKVRELIKIAQKMNHCEIRIINYSKCKRSLGRRFFLELGVDDTGFISNNGSRVNRSLSLGEYYVQLWMNELLGCKCGSILSDRFCDELPNVESEMPAVDPDVLSEFLKKIKPSLERVNLLISKEEQYDIKQVSDYGNLIRPLDEEDVYLDLKQIRILFDAFREVVNNPQTWLVGTRKHQNNQGQIKK